VGLTPPAAKDSNPGASNGNRTLPVATLRTMKVGETALSDPVWLRWAAMLDEYTGARDSARGRFTFGRKTYWNSYPHVHGHQQPQPGHVLWTGRQLLHRVPGRPGGALAGKKKLLEARQTFRAGPGAPGETVFVASHQRARERLFGGGGVSYLQAPRVAIISDEAIQYDTPGALLRTITAQV